MDRSDILGNQIQDYDLVWFGSRYGLRLACVKQVVAILTIPNPAYTAYYQAQNWNVPRPSRTIKGPTDRFLMVLPPTIELANITPYLSTERISTLKSCVLIDDPQIINSPLAQSLREKALKTKK